MTERPERIIFGGGMDVTMPRHLIPDGLFRRVLNFHGEPGQAVKRRGCVRVFDFAEEPTPILNPVDGSYSGGSLADIGIIVEDCVFWNGRFYMAARYDDYYFRAGVTPPAARWVGLFALDKFTDGRLWVRVVDAIQLDGWPEWTGPMRLRVVDDRLFMTTGRGDQVEYDLREPWKARKWGAATFKEPTAAIEFPPYMLFSTSTYAEAASRTGDVYLCEPYQGFKFHVTPGPLSNSEDGILSPFRYYTPAQFRWSPILPGHLFGEYKYRGATVVETEAEVVSNASEASPWCNVKGGYPEVYNIAHQPVKLALRRMVNAIVPEIFSYDDLYVDNSPVWYDFNAAGWIAEPDATRLADNLEILVDFKTKSLGRMRAKSAVSPGYFNNYLDYRDQTTFPVKDAQGYYIGQKLNIWNPDEVTTNQRFAYPRVKRPVAIGERYRYDFTVVDIQPSTDADYPGWEITVDAAVPYTLFGFDYTNTRPAVNYATILGNNVLELDPANGVPFTTVFGALQTVWKYSDITIQLPGRSHRANIVDMNMQADKSKIWITFFPGIDWTPAIRLQGDTQVQFEVNQSAIVTEAIDVETIEDNGPTAYPVRLAQLDDHKLYEESDDLQIEFVVLERFTQRPCLRILDAKPGEYGTYSHVFVVDPDNDSNIPRFARSAEIYRQHKGKDKEFKKVARRKGWEADDTTAIDFRPPIFIRDAASEETNLGPCPLAASEEDHSEPHAFHDFCEDKHNRLWGWQGTRLWWSEAGEPEYWPVGNENVFPSDVVKVVHVPPTTISLNQAIEFYVFCERGIYAGLLDEKERLTLHELPQIPRLSSPRGAVVKDGVVYFVSSEGVFALNGLSLEKKSQALDGWFVGLNAYPADTWRNATLAYYQPHDEIHVMVSLPGASGEWHETDGEAATRTAGPERNICLALSLRNGQWRTYQHWIKDYPVAFTDYVQDGKGRTWAWLNWLTAYPQNGVTMAKNKGGLFLLDFGWTDDQLINAITYTRHNERVGVLISNPLGYYGSPPITIYPGATYDPWTGLFTPASFTATHSAETDLTFYVSAVAGYKYDCIIETKEYDMGDPVAVKVFTAASLLAPVQQAGIILSAHGSWEWKANKNLEIWLWNKDQNADGLHVFADADPSEDSMHLRRILWDDESRLLGGIREYDVRRIVDLGLRERQHRTVRFVLSAQEYLEVMRVGVPCGCRLNELIFDWSYAGRGV